MPIILLWYKTNLKNVVVRIFEKNLAFMTKIVQIFIKMYACVWYSKAYNLKLGVYD